MGEWREVEPGVWARHPHRITALRYGPVWYCVYCLGRRIGRAAKLADAQWLAWEHEVSV